MILRLREQCLFLSPCGASHYGHGPRAGKVDSDPMGRVWMELEKGAGAAWQLSPFPSLHMQNEVECQQDKPLELQKSLTKQSSSLQ